MRWYDFLIIQALDVLKLIIIALVVMSFTAKKGWQWSKGGEKIKRIKINIWGWICKLKKKKEVK